MLVAQALGEYGAGALVDGISSAVLDVLYWATNLTPFEYALLVVAAVIVWLVINRR